MTVDDLYAGLRALMFVALFQACGAALFVVFFGQLLTDSRAGLIRLSAAAAGIAIGCLLALHLLEAARMAGNLDGLLDGELQTMVLESSLSVALAWRLAGLGFILAGLRSSNTARQVWLLSGVGLAMCSFTFVGHTVDHPARWLLSLFLFAHGYVAAFWFGGLLPLWLVSLRESQALAAQVTRRYSMLAVRLVPVLFLAGILLAMGLLRSFDDLTSPYGLLLLAKLGGFLLLLGLAAINRWQLVPAIERGEPNATTSLRNTLIAEYILIILIFIITAALTTFTSPPADFDISENDED